MNIFNIKNKAHLTELVELWDAEGVIKSEIFADALMTSYVFGENTILGVDRIDIFYLCMEIYCDQVSKGAIHSKWCIAKHLMTSVTYFWANPIVAKFLIDLAAYENEPSACEYIANKYIEFGEDDIATFWHKKGEIGFVEKVTGEPVNLVLDRDMKTIYMR